MKARGTQAWAILSRTTRTEWVIPHTIRWTRKQAIAAYLEEFNPESEWAHWFAHQGRVRAVKVTVQVLT